MGFHKETLNWLRQLDNVCNKVRPQAKNAEDFLNKIELAVLQENKELSQTFSKLHRLRRQRKELPASQTDAILKIQNEETLLNKELKKKEYPEDFIVTNKDLFLKIYYSG